jgi:hypothetical protein
MRLLPLRVSSVSGMYVFIFPCKRFVVPCVYRNWLKVTLLPFNPRNVGWALMECESIEYLRKPQCEKRVTDSGRATQRPLADTITSCPIIIVRPTTATESL